MLVLLTKIARPHVGFNNTAVAFTWDDSTCGSGCCGMCSRTTTSTRCVPTATRARPTRSKRCPSSPDHLSRVRGRGRRGADLTRTGRPPRRLVRPHQLTGSVGSAPWWCRPDGRTTQRSSIRWPSAAACAPGGDRRGGAAVGASAEWVIPTSRLGWRVSRRASRRRRPMGGSRCRSIGNAGGRR